MNDPVPPGLRAAIERTRPLTDRFTAAGHRLYLVGGVVRDHLLGRARDETDLDATTDARPERIKTLVAPLASAVWSQGERFGTIGCTIDDQVYEITTHRAEAYDRGSRKPVVTFGDRIEDDLARRDFTVNAMAVDCATGELVDPHGGADDLVTGVLRTPLDPETAFSEDPLRMLRAARFHAGYGLDPVPELSAAIAAMADRMAIVSVERIRDELQKLLLLDDPTPGLVLLVHTGLLARVLPMLGDADRDEVVSWGRTLVRLPADPDQRWAALFRTRPVDATTLGSLRFSRDRSRTVRWLLEAAGAASGDEPVPAGDAAVRRAAARTPAGHALDERLSWVEAIRRAQDRPVDDVVAARATLSRLLDAEPDLADPVPVLTGEQVCALLGIEPGPAVGRALTWLREMRTAEGPVAPEEAGARLVAWWAEEGRRG